MARAKALNKFMDTTTANKAISKIVELAVWGTINFRLKDSIFYDVLKLKKESKFKEYFNQHC